MTALQRASALLLLALLASACVRPIEVGSEPRSVFTLLVHNDLAEPMIVSYDDSRGDALLGTVAARDSQSFAITRPAAMRIAVHARNTTGGRRVGPYTVDLVAGVPQTVRIR